jgi:hypothetical protein
MHSWLTNDPALSRKQKKAIAGGKTTPDILYPAKALKNVAGRLKMPPNINENLSLRQKREVASDLLLVFLKTQPGV